ncbi:MAG: thiamine pyrophosphate-dependent enzyme [Myxococcales bacterium]|nr:thiamine pyrophosphate-dependent enzyme [Myxococcota bacterium]MDW8281779.1 thiamine pyrophosphate-dependent enzyme [Myxococcales bacterium]
MSCPIPGEVRPLAEDDPALQLRQILNEEGEADAGAVAALGLGRQELLRLYRGMLLIRVMDERLMSLQRQGRIGFYGEARGQEATIIGTAAALGERDYIVPALREAGAAIFRGLPLRLYIAQILGNANDVCKGHQMPCHPGTRAARYVTMSSCVGTQLPHATGMAYAMRLTGDEAIVVGYLGDGATAQADFHVALNFAGVWRVPVVFVCQNNQWAISTPVTLQSAAPTLAHRAVAYGMPWARVDGNDVLACYAVMREARMRALAGGGPTFIEALTYRMGAHSSSDDPSRYRDESVTEAWRSKDPLRRVERLLERMGILDAAGVAALRASLDDEVRETVAAEEQVGPPPLRSLVEDVFHAVPPHLEEQLAELLPLSRQPVGARTHG